jgi:cytochrome c-type biogenesis protein CcmH/NrfG
VLDRSFHRATAPTALLLAVLFLVAWAAPVTALPREKDTWIQLRSPHFTLFSNASERATREIALDLEQLRSALAQLNPDLELTSPVPTWIYVFKDTSSFAPYRLHFEGRPQSGEGYFISHPYGNHAAINGDPRRDATRLIYHEYLHDVLANNYPDLPLWLNEGLAEYYSTFEVAGSDAKIGLPIPLHVYWLLDNAMIPLEKLVEMDQSARDYNEGNRRGVFYAESWALVHYLLTGPPERRQQAAQYLRDLANGVRSAEAFQRAFGDLGNLESNLRAYVRSGLFNYQRIPVAQEANISLEIAPLSRPDALYRLGDLLLHNGDEKHAAAEEHFRAALKASPGHGAAQAGLGRIAQDAGRLAEARAHYEQAARAAPDDFFLQYLWGLSLLEPAPPEPATLPRAKKALQRAVELRPDFAEGWGRLAQAVSYENPLPPDAVAIYETAWRLMPSRDDFAVNLAQIYARTGQRPKAQKLIDEVLLPRKRLDYVEETREALLDGEWQEIEKELVQAGKLAEAAPRLEALLARMQASERRDTLQRRIDEIHTVLDYNGFADRYNRAIDFLNAGKDAEAMAILEELAARTRNPGQAEQARKLLDKVKAGPKGKG